MKYIIKNLLTNEKEKYKTNIYNKYELMNKISYYLDLEIPIMLTYDYIEKEDIM